MKEKDFAISGMRLISPAVHLDHRGCFFEFYRSLEYSKLCAGEGFVQDNCSISKRGVVRGMHFQRNPGQAKLVTVLDGEIYDVVVDIRPDSPTFGKWESVILNSERLTQLYIPAQCAHGFCTLSARAVVFYKTSTYFDPAEERVFRFDDAEVGIEWPIKDPILSKRDKEAPSFAEVVVC